MDNLWLKVENIVAKWEIACFEKFLARLFEEYESFTTCPGVGVGVRLKF